MNTLDPKTARILSTFDPVHEDIMVVNANASFSYDNGVVSTWVMTNGIDRDKVYAVTLLNVPDAKDRGLSLVSLGLQGTRNDIKILGGNNAEIGEQTSDSTNAEHIAWSKSGAPLRITATGLNAANRRQMAVENIQFLRAVDSTQPVFLRVSTRNPKTVEPNLPVAPEKHHQNKARNSGHDTIPPPFPPGSSEGD